VLTKAVNQSSDSRGADGFLGHFGAYAWAGYYYTGVTLRGFVSEDLIRIFPKAVGSGLEPLAGKVSIPVTWCGWQHQESLLVAKSLIWLAWTYLGAAGLMCGSCRSFLYHRSVTQAL